MKIPTLSLSKMQAFWQYKFTDIHEGCVKTKGGHQNDSAAVDNGNFQYCHSLVLRIFTGTEARPKIVSYRPGQ